jgi:hypothetical protein
MYECKLGLRTLLRHLDLQTVPTVMDSNTIEN